MNRAGEWIPFTPSKYCRRLQVYSMQWENDGLLQFNDEDTMVAVAPFGGPIAIAQAAFGGTGGAVVKLHSAAGVLFGEFALASDVGSIAAMGWSNEEALVLVSGGGTVLVHEMSGFSKPSFTHKFDSVIGGGAGGGGDTVVWASVSPCGAFAFTEALELHAVMLKEKRDPLPVSMALDTELTCPPACCAVLAPDLCELEEECIVFVGPGEDDNRFGSVLAVNLTSTSVEDLKLSFGFGVARLRLSFDGSTLAIFTFDGVLAVVPSDFSSGPTHTMRLGCKKPPVSMLWCGASYVYLTFNPLHFDDMEEDTHFGLLVPAYSGAQVKFEKLEFHLDGTGTTALVEEVDGVRIVTETTNYMLEVVSPALVNLYRLDSTSPSALLARAHADYMSGDIDGLSSIRQLAAKPGFADVLDEVIEAASHEMGVEHQHRLLRIAALCKCYSKDFDSDVYVDVCRRLRVLNSLRRTECGVSLTIRQHEHLSGSGGLRNLEPSEAQVLVDRLVNRRLYQLAFDIASVFRMNVEKILVHWSTARVAANAPDHVLRNDIVKTLSACPGVGFTDAALQAFKLNKPGLAIQLLDDEPRRQNQVLLFLQMNQDELALEKALQSDDTDLVHMVLLRILGKSEGDQEFFNRLSRFPAAQSIMSNIGARGVKRWGRRMHSFYKDSHQEHLIAYEQLQQLLTDKTAIQLARESDGTPEVVALNLDDDDNNNNASGGNGADGELYAGPLVTSLDDLFAAREGKPQVVGTTAITVDDVLDVCGLFSAAGSKYDDDAKKCKMHIDLLEIQRQLAEETGDARFHNESVVGTIYLCVTYGNDSRADQLRSKYGVADKKYWSTRLRGYCEAQNWDAVDRLGGGGRYSKVKSPIGFLPFVEALAKHNRQDQAAAFVERLSLLSERVEWFVKLDHFQKAVDAAAAEDNIDMLEQIRRRASNPQIIAYINQKIKELE